MPRPRTHDDALATRLVEEASRALARGGAEALSLRRVAAAAGTTTAAVYTLFGDKAGLVAAATAEGYRRFAAVLAAVPRTGVPGRDLMALGLAYRASALAEPDFYRAMFRSPADGDPSGREATFAVLRDAVVRVLEGPAVGPSWAGRGGAADADLLAQRLWGLAHGLVELELAGHLGLAEGAEERYRALLLAE